MSNYTLDDSYGIGNIMSSIYQKAVPITPGGKPTNTQDLSEHQLDIIRPSQPRKRKLSSTPTKGKGSIKKPPTMKQKTPLSINKKTLPLKPQKKENTSGRNITNIF
jgi:hypothetical protein